MKTIKFMIWYVGARPRLRDLRLLLRVCIRQMITEYLCKKYHNRWIETGMHGAGKYIYNVYQCAICKRMHVSFELNNKQHN